MTNMSEVAQILKDNGVPISSELTEYQRGIPPEKPLSLGDLIEPMPGKIAVQIETKKEMTPGGLYIPIDTARSVHEARATQGRVVAIGSDDEDDLASAPSRVSIGDTVIFGKYTGTKISWHPGGDRTKDKEELVIMYEKDLLAILRSPEEARHIKVKT